MIDREKLRYVIEEIVKQDYNYPLACKILDAFEEQATELEDYDTLGELSIKAKHDELRIRAAEFVYTHSQGIEQLFKCRENLYKAYTQTNQIERALFYIELNLEIKPEDPETLMSKAFCLSLLGRREQGEVLLEHVIALDPKTKRDLEYAFAGRQFRTGQVAAGIKNFMLKFKPPNPLFQDQLKLKFWDGGVYPGRTVVINGEGGVGDEIINFRFLKWFVDHGMHPILYSSWHKYRPDLTRLFERHGYEVTSVPLFFKPEYMWTHLMAVPGYIGVSEKDLWYGPYLTPLRQEKNRLADSNFKIGIKCNGNPFFEQDVYRRIPLEEMVAAMPDGVSIYYFDKERTHPRCINLIDKLETWDDTLDYIDQMDMIVSSCTSLVHAAGAMGKRTVVLTSLSEYYVWTSTRTNGTTPWYGDNLSIVRQTQPGDWSGPLSAAREIILQEINKHV